MARSDPNSQFERYQRQLEHQAAREQARTDAQAAREREKDDKARYLGDRRASAAERTEAVAQRMIELERLLSRAVAVGARPLDLGALRRTVSPAPLDLGVDADPVPAPEWSRFAPPTPGLLVRSLGRSRHERALADARAAFAAAERRHVDEESARLGRVNTARVRYAAYMADLTRSVENHNGTLDRVAAALPARDRLAVSDYYQMVVDAAVDPDVFPAARRAAYVPESEMLVVEWDLPTMDAVPDIKESTYVARSDTIKDTPMPVTARRAAYRRLIASIALRAVWLVFRSDPGGTVETVVVNGMIDEIDRSTGQDVRPCLITLRATRDQFEKIRIDRVDAVECVQKYFAADVSRHPDELESVAPVLTFDLADPRAIDPIDVLSEIDKRPNLLDLDGYGFEHFIQNLFAKMKLQVQVFRPGGDGGIDCVVYDDRSVFGGKYVVQAKRYTGTVPPTAVRDLYGAMLHEGATKGLLITTSGFGKASYQWANGKPLQLISGTELLGLCRQYEIPARIVPKS